MRGKRGTYSAMLKDRDYDVTPHIILILSLTLTQNARGGSAKVCEVEMVVEECKVKMVDEEWPVGETLVVVSSVTWSVQW